MKEFYLIIMFDNIRNFSETVALISFITFVSFIICYPFLEGAISDYCNIQTKKIFRSIIVTLAVSSAFMVFTPTKTEMFFIMGLGGTVDYLKQNDAAKQIPDKCLLLINKWMEEKLNEEKN